MIKVDFVGRNINLEMAATGTGRYIIELRKRLESQLDIRNINYRKYNLPFFKNKISLKIYESKVLNEYRRDSIMHIISHIDTSKSYFSISNNVVITCHDMFPYIFPKYPDKSNTQNIVNAQKIIAVSNATKNDIIRYLKVNPEKIEVIYEGLGDEFRRISQNKNEFLKKYPHLNEKQIILYVGNEEPRKNLQIIIKALYKLKRISNNIIFLKVGKPHWMGSRGKLKKLIISLNLQNEVFFIDNPTFEELPYIYNMANAFVFPSIYEGFGFPPLEAMACGVPVVSSNTSSLPEVLGDAGIMIDPNDVDGLTRAMNEVLTNEGLREDMIKKGLERAKLFSWDKTAKETLKVYKEIYEG